MNGGGWWCRETAAACGCVHAAERSLEPLNRYHRGLAHAKRMLGVAVLQRDSHRKALRETDPVQRRRNPRQTFHGGAIVLKERPANSLHDAAKAVVAIADQEDLRGHPRFDPGQEVLAEIRHHVPGPVIHQADHLLALVGILAHRDIEVGDISVERCLYVAVVYI